jgi:hypothetical protein
MALLTSAAAASAFRVGVSSIKRWTDEGELEAVRTPGGHRRYTPAALLRFAAVRGLPVDRLPQVTAGAPLPLPADITLYKALAAGNEAAVSHLVHPRVEAVARRAAFFDRVVGDALREIGYRWERAELTVEQEHRASHLIADALADLRPRERPGRHVAALACPPGELHELPLLLVRLIFEWSGWKTDFLGASLPWNAARSAVARTRPRVFAFTSRSGEPYRSADFEAFVTFCNERNVQVIVGGDWARGGTGTEEGYLRFRTLRGFERWLRSFPHD